MPTPVPYDVAELRAELLRPGGLWRRLDVVAETGSTNADLVVRARAGEAPGAVLITDYQSAGRGRQGRTWTAPPGSSIAMSVLVRPQVPELRWTWLPLLTGLAVSEGLRSAAAVAAELKWPNDVLVGSNKICGILAERVGTPGGPACVVGMGINVDLGVEELPVRTATSLRVLQPDRPHPRTDLVAAVLAAFELEFRRWEAGPDDTTLAAGYRQRCVTIGRPVEVRLAGDRVVVGTVAEVDADGRLVVRTDRGAERFGAGDVVHLR